MPRRGIVIGLVATLGFGVLLGWAGKTLLGRPAPLPTQQAFSIVETSDGAVSRSIRLAAQATWTGGTSVPNGAEGVVTGHRIKGAVPVKSGQALYDVDLRPVTVAQGTVPAFRALSVGAKGADVRQLQQMLAEVGVRSAKPDGVFGSQTARQVRAWQRESGQPVTGQIASGSLVFVPTLPATVVLGDGLAVGSRVSAASSASPESSDVEGGDGAASATSGAVVRVLPRSPRFTISLPENQTRLARAGMRVDIDHGDGQPWGAVIEQVTEPSADGTATAVLRSMSSASICGRECATVPVTGAAGLDATIVIVPETKGVVVPAAALVVGADGDAAVLKADGTRVPVTVKASSGGRSVVEGVSVGTELRVPGAP